MITLEDFLTPRGRINRRTFLLSTLVLWTSVLALGRLIPIIKNDPWDELMKLIWLFRLFGWIVLFYWINTMMGIKRLHDLNRSGWWAVFMYLVPVLCYGIARSGVWMKDDSGILGMVCHAGVHVVSFCTGILFLWPGSRGDNRFGRSPRGLKWGDKNSGKSF